MLGYGKSFKNTFYFSSAQLTRKNFLRLTQIKSKMIMNCEHIGEDWGSHYIISLTYIFPGNEPNKNKFKSQTAIINHKSIKKFQKTAIGTSPCEACIHRFVI